MSVEDTVARHGYDLRHTPIDTLMAAREQMHRDVAEAMENPEED